HEIEAKPLARSLTALLGSTTTASPFLRGSFFSCGLSGTTAHYGGGRFSFSRSRRNLLRVTSFVLISSLMDCRDCRCNSIVSRWATSPSCKRFWRVCRRSISVSIRSIAAFGFSMTSDIKVSPSNHARFITSQWLVWHDREQGDEIDFKVL